MAASAASTESCWHGSENGDARAENFWRTSCFHFFVARKYHVREFAGVTAEVTAAKLGLARVQIAASGFPTRVKKIHALRRRLPVTFFYERPVQLKMRHAGQNLGSVLKMLPVQNQRL
jgi:hypothetical protein